LTPLVLRVLDLPVPDGLDGQLPGDVLEADWLRHHPPVSGPAYAGPVVMLPDSSGREATAADQVLRDELRALGYIE
jgi:hypothetical protein